MAISRNKLYLLSRSDTLGIEAAKRPWRERRSEIMEYSDLTHDTTFRDEIVIENC